MQSDGQTLDRVIGKDAVAISGIYDEQLRPFGVGAAQFVLLVAIYKMEPATRAEIGRVQHQDRSILTRNLKLIISEGWVEEKQGLGDGRSRPLGLTKAGMELLCRTESAWRAAQARAKTLLGADGVVTVIDIADRIVETVA
jgi:DNA-binding MarR family transcriptional regulator